MGGASKQRSLFASENVLTGLEHRHDVLNSDGMEERVYSMTESKYEHLVFAGNGMSALACVEGLLQNGGAFDITIFGDEPHANYDRTLLAAVLAGERDADSITLNDIEWYQEHGIRTRIGIRVEEIDRTGRAVRSSDGDWTAYDKLILATGSRPALPAIDGLDKPGVFVFATLDDARLLADAAGPGVRAVVVGGWLAGEVARALRKRGCEVVIAGSSGVESAVLAGTDIVVMAELEPNTALACSAGLAVGRGVIVNDRLETSDPHIFAIGGCTEHNGQIFDCLPPVMEQARVLAANFAGAHERRFMNLNTVFQELTTSPLHQRAE